LNRTVERLNRTVKGFKWASKLFNRTFGRLNRTVEGFEWVFKKKRLLITTLFRQKSTGL